MFIYQHISNLERNKLISLSMQKLILLAFLLCSQVISAQSVVGKWVTWDDETKKPKSEVEIYEKGGKYFAKVVALFNLPAGVTQETAICDKCKGDKKDKPIIGMNVIEDMVKKGDEYKDGKITDPKNGKSYNCSFKIDPKDSNAYLNSHSIVTA